MCWVRIKNSNRIRIMILKCYILIILPSLFFFFFVSCQTFSIFFIIHPSFLLLKFVDFSHTTQLSCKIHNKFIISQNSLILNFRKDLFVLYNFHVLRYFQRLLFNDQIRQSKIWTELKAQNSSRFEMRCFKLFEN